MGYGSTAKILRVDLSAGSIEIETLDEAFYRQFPGGKHLRLSRGAALHDRGVCLSPLGQK